MNASLRFSALLLLASAVFTISLVWQAKRAVHELRRPVSGVVDLRLSAPLYTAYTADGRAIRVRAFEGLPDGVPPKVIELIRPEAELTADGVLTRIIADRGRYVIDEHTIYMTGNTRLTRSDGVSLQADRARVNTDAGTALAEGHVRLDRKGTAR